MQKLLILATTVFCLFTIGCKKQTKDTTLSITSAQALMRVMDDVPNEDLKATYMSLTGEEMRSVWLAHFDTFQSHHTLNELQMHLLDSVRSFFSTVSFTDSNNNSQSFFNSWYPLAQQVFTPDEIYLIGFTLYDNLDDEIASFRPNVGNNGSETTDCNCDSDSWFSCVFNPDKCTRGGCKAGKGCGFGFFWKCNRLCRLI